MKFIHTVYVVFVTFLIDIAIVLASQIVSGIGVYIFIGQNNDMANLTALPIAVITNSIICNLKIMKKGFAFLFEKGNRYKGPLAILSFTVLMLYITMNELFNAGIDTTKYRAVYLSFTAFFAAVVGFFIRYLYMAVKENDEKNELAKQNKALADEKHDVSEWFEKIRHDIESRPPGAAAEIAAELGDLAPRRDWHASLKFPPTGMASLDVYLKSCHDDGLRDGVDVIVLVRERLNHIKGRQAKQSPLLSMIGNYVSNAMKALRETERENKQISVEFGLNGETGVYEIEIFDNAHEFDAGVLKNLGKEGNTTNGTGRGFPNTMRNLAKLGASLAVREWGYDDAKDVFTKCMVIKFDGKGECHVESHRFGRFEVRVENETLVTV